jgi:carbon monoxide dehydrogenase subunit G
MKFSSSVVISAPPEKVFALVDNLEEWPEWIPSIKKIEKVSEGPLKEGSQVRVTAKAGITVGLLMTITEFVPGQRGILEGRVLGVKMTRYYRFEPVEQGTRLTVGGEVSGPLAFLVRRGGQAISEEIVRAAKNKIEGLGGKAGR